MNCQDLANVIVDAASDRSSDQPELEEMLAHTAACRGCAARLADQRALSAGLGRLAALTRNEKAPAGVEAALRAAYRERILTPAPPVSPLAPPASRWTRWALAAAAAAAILAVLAMTSLRLAPTDSSKQRPRNTEAIQQPPEPRPTAPNEKVEAPTPPKQTIIAHRSKPRSLGNYRVEHRTQSGSRDEAAKGTREIATDFMPLSGSDLIPIEGGSVVRVELPRSALASFGLPMNMERAGERIKADVVVGNDGLARAIRFVR